MLSNLPGDTQKFIKDYECGFQFSAAETGKLSEQILTLTDSQYQAMRHGAARLYNEKLRFETFSQSLMDGIESIFK
jgi:hypothetical protein